MTVYQQTKPTNEDALNMIASAADGDRFRLGRPPLADAVSVASKPPPKRSKGKGRGKGGGVKLAAEVRHLHK
eukprot:6959766-Pyramimonas_sp.AAC.2